MNWWVSWYHKKRYSEFELHSPWWISGWRASDGAETVCAAIKAQTEDEVIHLIYEVYDKRPKSIEFRFIEQRDDEWSPFTERFQYAEWMQWDENKGGDKPC